MFSPYLSSPCAYSPLPSLETKERRKRLEEAFCSKKILLDETALTGLIARIKEQFQTRCHVVTEIQKADLILTTKAQWKNIQKEKKERIAQRKKDGESRNPVTTKRHRILMAKSTGRKQDNISVLQQYIDLKKGGNVYYYEEWRSEFDRYWKCAKEDPAKMRFPRPPVTTQAYVYITDAHGLYKIEPVAIPEMPSIPTGLNFPCTFEDRKSCPFRMKLSQATKRKEKFNTEQKKSKKKRDKQEWCDCCRMRVLNFRKHERTNQHKRRVANTDWKDLDAKIALANQEWVEAKKKTMEFVRIQQEFGKNAKLPPHPVTHMGDVESFILALEGKAEPISAEEMEQKRLQQEREQPRKRRKMCHGQQKQTLKRVEGCLKKFHFERVQKFQQWLKLSFGSCVLKTSPKNSNAKVNEKKIECMVDKKQGRANNVSDSPPRITTNHTLLEAIDSEIEEEKKRGKDDTDSDNRLSNSGIDDAPPTLTSPDTAPDLNISHITHPSDDDFLDSPSIFADEYSNLQDSEFC